MSIATPCIRGCKVGDLLQPRSGAGATLERPLHLFTPMPTLYHVAPAANLSSILDAGLQPQIGPRSASAGESVAAVYCFTDLAAVEDALTNWLGDCFGEDEALALLRIDVDNDVGLGAGAGYEVMVLAPIPARALAVLSEDVGNDEEPGSHLGAMSCP